MLRALEPGAARVAVRGYCRAEQRAAFVVVRTQMPSHTDRQGQSFCPLVHAVNHATHHTCTCAPHWLHSHAQTHIFHACCLLLLLLLLPLQPGAARPEIIAEVASSLADMLYASDKLVDAKGALQVGVCGCGGGAAGGGEGGRGGLLKCYWCFSWGGRGREQ